MGWGTIWMDYQVPYELDTRADFATFSNEDIGFIASLVTGTNDTYEYAQPFPSSYDLFEDAMVWYRTDHMFGVEGNDVADGETVSKLDIYSSFLQVEFAVTFQGSYADSTDEAMKTKLHGPMSVGQRSFLGSTAGASSVAHAAYHVDGNQLQNVHEYAINRQGYDIFTPYYYVLVNKSHDWAAQTGITVTASYVAFENFMQRIWHRKRSLTPQERNFRMVAARFMFIDT